MSAALVKVAFDGASIECARDDAGTVWITLLVISSLVVLTWPVSMRLMRSSVLSTKQADYIVAARALGASNGRIIRKHLIPNCLAPLLVYSTILVGGFISAEATLSFLGVGLQSPVVSWGIMISEAVTDGRKARAIRNVSPPITA